MQRSLTQNSNLPYAKYMQLATARADGRPAARTVVFRGFLDGSDHLTFVTDRRSRKVSELADNPHVEVCWYFPTSREQFRLSGTAHIVALDHPHQQLLAARQQAWAAMSDAGRSQFLWPEPGQPRMPMDESLFLVPAPDTAGQAVDNFCLGVIHVHEVDHVDLFANKRAVFTSSQEQHEEQESSSSSRTWAVENVNP